MASQVGRHPRRRGGRTRQPSPEQYARFTDLLHLVKEEFHDRTGRETIAVTGIRAGFTIEIKHANGDQFWARTVTGDELTRPNPEAVAKGIVAEFLAAR